MGALWIYMFGVGCLFSKPLKAFGDEFQTANDKTTYQTALETCRRQYKGSVALPRDADENGNLTKFAIRALGQGSTVWLGATLTLFPWRFRQSQEAVYKPLENQGCFRSSDFTVEVKFVVTLKADYEMIIRRCAANCTKTYVSANTHLTDNGKPLLSCSCSEEIDGTAIGKNVCPYRCSTSSDLWCSKYAEIGFTLARVYKRRSQDGQFYYVGCYRSMQKSITRYNRSLEVTSTMPGMSYGRCIDLCGMSDFKFAGIGAILQAGRFAIACSCSNSLNQSFQTKITYCPAIKTADRWNFTTIDVYSVYHTQGFKPDGAVYQAFVQDNDNSRTCGFLTAKFKYNDEWHAIVGKTQCGNLLPSRTCCVNGSGKIDWSDCHNDMSWYEAKEYCHGLGTSLPTIKYAYQGDLYLRGPFWVALVGRTWKDHRGSELSFTRWSKDATHDVDNRCLYMETDTGKWRDDDCQSQHAVVCDGTNLGTTEQPSETSAIPTTSTVTTGAYVTADTGNSSVHSSEQGGGGASWKLITGTIVGVIVLVVLAVVLVVLFMKRKRNGKRCPENAAPSGLDNRTYGEVQLSTISGGGPVINNKRDADEDGGSEPTYYNTRDTCRVPGKKTYMADTATGKRTPKDNEIAGEMQGPRAGQRLTEPEQLPIYAVVNKPKYHTNNSQSENPSYESDEDEVTLVENDTYVENTRTGCTKKGENGVVLTRLEEKPKKDALGSNSRLSRPALEGEPKVSHEEVIYDQNKGDGEYFENVSDWLKTKSDNQ